MLALNFWRFVYRLLLVVARPWVHLRLRLRQRSEPEYGERIAERFGRVPDDVPVSPVWFHTVSAGETIAAAPFIRRLAEDFPQQRFLVTTMTPTGSAQVQGLLGDRVAHCYAPYDFGDAIGRFFDRVQPRLLVLMETELWPNMLEAARSRNTPAMLVNARLSERSARGYARIGALTARMLESLKLVACQYPDHAERFVDLGADRERVVALGSVKFDVELPEDHAACCADLRDRWQLGDRPVWIAASTHPGEEEQVLEAHGAVRAACPDALLILVPRHPNRREAVAALIEQVGFSYGRMSDGDGLAHLDVILGDTMGRLLYLYGLSQVAFVGGSLIQHGGHNPIEAAVCAQPVLMGPELHNFPDVAAVFQSAGCLVVVADAAALAREVIRYLTDFEVRQQAAEAAGEVVTANRGATDRLLALLERELVSL